MSNKKETENKGMWYSEKNECLFTKPFIYGLLEKNELPELFKKVEGMNDHRLLAIVTALLVENRIDKVNALFLPKYKKLSESNDFTFSMKIKLLEALNFIPNTITLAANCFREIRNEFAHNLEKHDFAHIKHKTLENLRSLSHKVYLYAGDETDDRDDLLKSFKKLSFFCITGLDVYAGNIKLLRSEITGKDFLEKLEQTSNSLLKKSMLLIERASQSGATHIEIKDNQIIETFKDGTTKVCPLEEIKFES